MDKEFEVVGYFPDSKTVSVREGDRKNVLDCVRIGEQWLKDGKADSYDVIEIQRTTVAHNCLNKREIS